mmetsp:Transcript_8088/g.6032  ORF Transcript_8088/g.6032 Transcript_8088/m.6032 type:complete len:104 (+) Transcript_8088:338-649(+)
MITNLVNDLLDLAKLEKQTFQINCNYFNLLESIQASIQSTSFLAQQKGITLRHVCYEEDLSYFLQLYGDQSRYIQFLINFVSNSLKFTPKQGTVTIETELKQT